MNLLPYSLLFPLVASVAGVITACFMGRVPMSGKGSVAILAFPTASILLLTFVEFGGVARELVAGALFGFSVPICLAYSFHVRRRAPDRRFALAGLVGSILFGLLYLLMMHQLAFYFVREIVEGGF